MENDGCGCWLSKGNIKGGFKRFWKIGWTSWLGSIKKESRTKEEEVSKQKKQFTLQIASISSKIMTCRSLSSLKNQNSEPDDWIVRNSNLRGICLMYVYLFPQVLWSCSISTKRSHIFFSFTNKFAEDFRAIYNLYRL